MTKTPTARQLQADINRRLDYADFISEDEPYREVGEAITRGTDMDPHVVIGKLYVLVVEADEMQKRLYYVNDQLFRWLLLTNSRVTADEIRAKVNDWFHEDIAVIQKHGETLAEELEKLGY